MVPSLLEGLPMPPVLRRSFLLLFLSRLLTRFLSIFAGSAALGGGGFGFRLLQTMPGTPLLMIGMVQAARCVRGYACGYACGYPRVTSIRGKWCWE